jgi:hypothetical protein
MQTLKTSQANEETASKDLLKVLSHLATIVTDNRTASDVSEAPKFSGRTEAGTPGISSLEPISKQRDG